MILLQQIKDWFDGVKDDLRPYLEEKQVIEEKEKGLDEEIEEAHQKWIEAQNYFQNVSEPELVDHASYMIQAAETKYMYLLNKAKDDY